MFLDLSTERTSCFSLDILGLLNGSMTLNFRPPLLTFIVMVGRRGKIEIPLLGKHISGTADSRIDDSFVVDFSAIVFCQSSSVFNFCPVHSGSLVI